MAMLGLSCILALGAGAAVAPMASATSSPMSERTLRGSPTTMI